VEFRAATQSIAPTTGDQIVSLNFEHNMRAVAGERTPGYRYSHTGPCAAVGHNLYVNQASIAATVDIAIHYGTPLSRFRDDHL